MAERPDVTIVVAVGGAEAGRGLDGLQRSLESIGGDPLVQILAVPHAGVTAGEVDWLCARAAADPRLAVLTDDAGEGDAAAGSRETARARNRGIAAATAPLLAFLDPGDVWLPGKLGAQRALHAGYPALGFSFSDARRAGTSGRGGVFAAAPRFHARHGGHGGTFLLGADARAQLAEEDVVPTSSVVARTHLARKAGGFPLDIAAPERDLWQRLAGLAPVACRAEPTVVLAGSRADAVASARAPLAALGEIVARQLRAAWRQEPWAIRAALRSGADSPARRA